MCFFNLFNFEALTFETREFFTREFPLGFVFFVLSLNGPVVSPRYSNKGPTLAELIFGLWNKLI